MKSLVVAVLLFLAVAMCSAQMIQKQDNIKYQIVSKGGWNNTGIIAEDSSYESFFPQAIANPGMKIKVEVNSKFLKLRLPFRQLNKLTTRAIVYDDSKKIINIVESTEEKEEGSVILLFCIISIILMIVSNIQYSRGIDFATRVFMPIFSLAAIGYSFLFSSNLLGLAASAAAFFTALAALHNESTVYKSLSAAYYVAVILFFITALM